jgi:hypothetical protein
MLLSLTVQQQAQRCRCGRLLAWSYRSLGTDQTRYADPVEDVPNVVEVR